MTVIDFYSLSDKAIEEELGSRIKSLRLRKNITQKQLAETTLLSLNTIKSLESGRGKLSTLIAVLRELGALDHLQGFIPEVSISPMQLVGQRASVRLRASGGRLKKQSKDESEW